MIDPGGESDDAVDERDGLRERIEGERSFEAFAIDNFQPSESYGRYSSSCAAVSADSPPSQGVQ